MYVIFGASGKVGARTAANLLKAGRHVRAVVRDEGQVARFSSMGCETMVADLTDHRSVTQAIEGARAVQILCPIPTADTNPASTMRAMIDVAAAALHENPPPVVLALSDYGAQLEQDTGITLLYHYLEAQLSSLRAHLIFLRSAEHMENWARVVPAALEKGLLPSLHHPLDKAFPTVSAHDVGAIAADLLLEAAPSPETRVVNVEGPHRVAAFDVARALTEVCGQHIAAVELPRSAWTGTLVRAGLSERHAELIADLYDAHNAGRIDVEPGKGERRFGSTTLSEAFSSMLPSRRSSQPHH
ncbi:MAG TPA: NAD(P)H-binding protein [Trinickia sp.]|nr:NAD(P)H-binding protein [Trinickia sp.]